MYVLVWYEHDYDTNELQVISHSEDEELLYKVKRLFDGVEKIEGWRLQEEYVKSLSNDVGFSIPSYGNLDVLKVDEQKDFTTTNLDKFLKDVSCGVISEEVLKEAEDNELKQRLLTEKLKKSFIEQVQWQLHYDLGYPAARVAGVKERISEMFESNQADIGKSAAEIVEYFERFNKE